MPLKFGMSWSPKTGVVFHGGATLEVDLPDRPRPRDRAHPGHPPVDRRRAAAGAAAEACARCRRHGGARDRAGVRRRRADGRAVHLHVPREGRQPRPARHDARLQAAEGDRRERRRRAGERRRLPVPRLRQGRVRRRPAPGDRGQAVRDRDRAAQHALPGRVGGLLAGGDHQRRVPADQPRLRLLPRRPRRDGRDQPVDGRAGAARRDPPRRRRLAAVPGRPDPARAPDRGRRRRDLPAHARPVRRRPDGQVRLGPGPGDRHRGRSSSSSRR